MLAAAQQRRAMGARTAGAPVVVAPLPRRARAAAAAAVAATAGARRRSRQCAVAVRAHASMATGTQLKMTGFVGQMRQVAMKLHTREQAPKEGGTDAPPKPQAWVPTRAGYARFLAESKVVFGAFESIMAAADGHPEYAKFRNTGLERTAALTEDLAWMASEYGVVPPEPKADSPGNTYAAFLTELAQTDAPAFICHYYNFFFAHTAGGRMIGSKVSQDILGGKDLAFYRYGGPGGDVAPLLDAVRESINGLAEGWTDAQKARCLEETSASFKWSGQLLRLITETE